MAHVSGNPPWLNLPNKTSPLNAQALERIEVALDGFDPRIAALEIEPPAHAGSHASGGSDPITPASIGAAAGDDPRLRDTGWRLLTLINGWTSASGNAAISPAYRRIGKVVYIRTRNLDGSAATDQHCATLPVGFRPPSSDGGLVLMGSTVRNATVVSTGLVRVLGGAGVAGAGAAMSFALISEDAFPAEPYPSTPA